MAEKWFKVIHMQKYDTLENWLLKNPVLMEGEIAVATYDGVADGEGAMPSNVSAVYVKIGDGVHNYSELPFLTAKAGDVYSWAKQENKPTYTAAEIQGLADYINDNTEDTNTLYRIIPDEDNSKRFLFQSKEKDDTAWATAYALVIPDDITFSLSSEGDGTLTLTPSKGEASTVTIVTLDYDKGDIATGSTNVPTSGALADYVDDKLSTSLEDLDYEDTPVDGQFVTEVSQEDGIITVKRRAVTVSDISDLTFNTTYDKDTNKAATIADINQALVGVHQWKGAKDTITDLPDPDDESNHIGDVWHIRDTGDEYSLSVDDDGNNYWELLGSKTDLSGYYTKDETDDLLDAKQDVLSEDNKLPVAFVSGTATDEADGLMSKEDKAKLDSIEGAEANKIEKIIAGDQLLPIVDKTVTLSKIAETGNVNDLIQTDGDVLILCGGDSTGARPAPSSFILDGGNSVTDR